MDVTQLRATKAPMLFIFGDADGIRLDHFREIFRLKQIGSVSWDGQ